MKLNKVFSALLLTAATALAFTACDSNIPENPNNKPGGQDTTGTNPNPTPLGDTLTVADLLQMKENNTLPEKDKGTTQYYVKGYIVGYYEFIEAEKKSTFNIGTTTTINTNVLIADDPECTDTYKVAAVKLATGSLFQDALNLADHPENLKKAVKLHGIVEEYCGVGGVVGIDEAYIDGKKVTSGIDGSNIDYQDGELSVTELLAKDDVNALPADGKTESAEYSVRGIVSRVQEVSLSYGNAKFYITDGEKEFYCFQIKGVGGAKLVSSEQVKKGDIVTVKGKVINYNKTLEIKNGEIVRTTNTFDPNTEIKIDTITVSKALELGAALKQGESTPVQYKIVGAVVENVEEASTQYGNLTFSIKDESTTETIYCYRLKYVDNKSYTTTDHAFAKGDVVSIIAQIKNYNGKIQLAAGYVSEHIY